MARPVILLLVAALAAAAWWIAASAGPGGARAPADDQGLVVHVFVADREGKPITPAQVIQVYDEARAQVDDRGYVRLTDVTLRADEQPSAEAFTFALKPLARHHALRRGFAPTATQRDDGSWEVRYALHAHGILRVHVEAVDLGPSKAFLERDEPLQRWEPVGGHAVVRPGSVVDFRIYEGWDAPGHDGRVPVRLVGEPGSDGVIGVATQRVLVDAPSPGHTAQLKLVPEPVDPIAGLVRVKEGPPPPTLRGRMLVRQIEEDGSRIELGEIPIDDAGEFVFRDAGAGRYELVAGLDFAPGLITTTCEGGDYLELETPGRARWVTLEHAGFDTRGTQAEAFVAPAEAWTEAYPFAPTIHDVLLDAWKATRLAQVGVAWEGPSTVGTPAMPPGWRWPAIVHGDGRTLVPLPGPGAWSVTLHGDGTHERAPLRAATVVSLGDDASEAQATLALEDAPHVPVVVRVSPDDWGEARSVTLQLGSRKRTVVRGGRMETTFAHVATADAFLPQRLQAVWDDDAIAPWYALPTDTPLEARARQGGRFALRLLGEHAAGLTPALVADVTGLGPGAPAVRLRRHGVEPIWVSTRALPPGSYRFGGLGVEAERAGPAGRRPLTLRYGLAEGGGRAWLALDIEAGKTTTLDFELPTR